MMGAMLSKFSRMGQIRSFKGEVFQDNQNVEEFEDFSEESDTFQHWPCYSKASVLEARM